MAGIAVLKDNVKLYLGSTTLTTSDKMSNIASIGDIGGGEVEEIDVTTIDSQAKEYVPGFADSGSFDIVQNVTDDEYVKVKAWADAGSVLKCGVVFVDAPQCNLGFDCFIKSYKLTGISVGGTLQISMTVRISGAITTFVEPS